MGLVCSLEDPASLWGLPTTTPELFLPVDYSPVIEIFATTAVEQAKRTCPVDTGYLQSSISASGGTITVGADYAQYVEYGTWKSPAQPFLTPAVQAGAMIAYTQAEQIYQQALEIEAMILAASNMIGQITAAMMGGAGMMPTMGDQVHPGTGMSQATADSILDNYAKEHGISVPGQNHASLSGTSLFMTGTSPSNWGNQMGPGWGNGIARNIGANLGLLVGGNAYFSGAAGNLMSGALGMFVGGLTTIFLTLLFDSMAEPEEEFSIAIPEITVI